jgi:hypothetical protein
MVSFPKPSARWKLLSLTMSFWRGGQRNDYVEEGVKACRRAHLPFEPLRQFLRGRSDLAHKTLAIGIVKGLGLGPRFLGAISQFFGIASSLRSGIAGPPAINRKGDITADPRRR